MTLYLLQHSLPLSGHLHQLAGRVLVISLAYLTDFVVVVVAYTPWSPELPSDLEDSDRRLIGRAKVELASSPYAGGKLPLPLPAVCVEGRGGSSKVTLLLLPEGALSDIVFLLSFFSFFETFKGSSAVESKELFVRPDNRILDFFFGCFVTFMSIVGAVVMISGAEGSLSTRYN